MVRLARCSLFLLCAVFVRSEDADASPSDNWSKRDGVARPDCRTWTTCGDCTSANGWLWGSSCQWCPQDNECHELHSWFSSCWHWQELQQPDQCSEMPPSVLPGPAPGPSPQSDELVVRVLRGLWAWHADLDPGKCVRNLGGADVALRRFAKHFNDGHINAESTTVDLGLAVAALSDTVTPCNVPQLQHRLDAVARAVQWAEVDLKDAQHVLVGGRNMIADFGLVQGAVREGDWHAVGSKLAVLIDNWSIFDWDISCPGGNEVCLMVSGLLKQFTKTGLSAEHVLNCGRELMDVVGALQDGAERLHSKDFSGAIGAFADALHGLSESAELDQCGLGIISTAARGTDEALRNARIVVRDEAMCCKSADDEKCSSYHRQDGAGLCSSSMNLHCGVDEDCAHTSVQILVGPVDVAELIFAIAEVQQGGYHATVGVHLWKLFTALQSYDCETQVCVVVQNFLPFVDEAFPDLSDCKEGLDVTWDLLKDFLHAIRHWKWAVAIHTLGDIFGSLVAGVAGCSPASHRLESFAKLCGASASSAVGNVMSALVGGVDTSMVLEQLIADADDDRWDAVGKGFGTLTLKLSQSGCSSFVCDLVEGMLSEVGMVFSHYEACMDEVLSVEDSLAVGASLWSTSQFMPAIRLWSTGLSQIMTSLQACDVEGHLGLIKQEANLFGFGNLSVIDKITHLVVHGQDYYEEFSGFVEDMSHHDFSNAGIKLGKVMNDFSTWTTGHLCTSPMCYAIGGTLQYLGDVEADMGSCRQDLRSAEQHIHDAFSAMVDHVAWPLKFKSMSADIRTGIREISSAFSEVAAIVADCHLHDLAGILSKIAEALLKPAKVHYIAEVVHIAINGFSITGELIDICKGFDEGNWPQIGYHFAKLSRLLSAEELQEFAEPFPMLHFLANSEHSEETPAVFVT